MVQIQPCPYTFVQKSTFSSRYHHQSTYDSLKQAHKLDVYLTSLVEKVCSSCHFGSSHQCVASRLAGGSISFMGEVIVAEPVDFETSGIPLFALFCIGLWTCGCLFGWCCLPAKLWPVRPSAVFTSPPRIGVRDFPFSPKCD